MPLTVANFMKKIFNLSEEELAIVKAGMGYPPEVTEKDFPPIKRSKKIKKNKNEQKHKT
jgi:hypothetical protein